MSLGKKSIFLILLILLIDQVLKIWVKTHMQIGQNISLFGNWGMLHFIENNGMAFGMEMGGKPGKFILSIFSFFPKGGYLDWWVIFPYILVGWALISRQTDHPVGE